MKGRPIRDGDGARTAYDLDTLLAASMKGRPIRDGDRRWPRRHRVVLSRASMKGRPIRDGDRVDYTSAVTSASCVSCEPCRIDGLVTAGGWPLCAPAASDALATCRKAGARGPPLGEGAGRVRG